MNNIELMWQAMDNIDKMLDKLGIPKEPPKGSFYDLSGEGDPDSNEDEKPKLKSGGQPGNQNARKHGLYSKQLPPQKLEDYNDALRVSDLGPEIAIVRVRLNELLNDPEASPDLINRTLSVLGRLMNIQRRYIYG